MNFDVRIRKMRTKGVRKSLQAFFTLSLGGVIEIEDMRLIDGSNGRFIGFPSKKIVRNNPETGIQEDQWFELVRLARDGEGRVTEDAREIENQILQAAVAEYDRISGTASNRPEYSEAPF